MKLSSSSEIYLEMANEWNISTEKLSVLRKNNDSFIEISADLEKTLIPEHKNSKVSMLYVVSLSLSFPRSGIDFLLMDVSLRCTHLFHFSSFPKCIDFG
jgi:hypothetical protein